MEDEWVVVEAPNSLPVENRRLSMLNKSIENICPKMQIKYEATAEISDASPCMSVTLRLLSLQMKTSVCIDEIYVYADPVEDSDPDPPVSNAGAGSLLSILAPGLLQLSKFKDKVFHDALTGRECSFSSERTINAKCQDKQKIPEVEESTMMGNFKVGVDEKHENENFDHPSTDSCKDLERKMDENNVVRCCVENLLDEPSVKQNQIKNGDGKSRSREDEKSLDQSRTDINDEMNAFYVRFEKILVDLVTRVGKIENVCRSFQESILKPLTGIEVRIQRIEEQVDALSKAHMPSEMRTSTGISHLSASKSNLENVVSATADSPTVSNGKAAADDLLSVSLPEFEKRSGLVVKIPEFLDDDNDDDDDDEDDNDDNKDDETANFRCSIDLMPNEYTINCQCSTIDNALASALAAFTASTTSKFSLHNSNPIDAPDEWKNCEDDVLDSPAVAVHSETDGNSVPEWILGDRNFEASFEDSDETYGSEDDTLDDELNKFDMIDRDKENVQGNVSSDESLEEEDDSSAEVVRHESKGLIIRAPEFPSDDDILDSNETFDPHGSSYFPFSHSPVLSPSQSTPLALFLSSRRISPSEGSLIFHDNPLELSSDINSFSASTIETHEGSDGMRTSSLESHANSAANSSLVGFFLSQGGSSQRLDIFDEETPIRDNCFMIHRMEDANHVLKCDQLHSSRTSESCAITQNLLSCTEPHSDRNYVYIQNRECCLEKSKMQAAESDLFGKFEAVGDIIIKNIPNPEYSNSNDANSSIGASGQPSETTNKSRYFDDINWINSHTELKQIPSFIPSRDDFTCEVKFHANNNLSWLPLETLLGKKHDDDKPLNDGHPKPVEEYLSSSFEFSVDPNLGSGLPLEVLLDETPPDQTENSDNGLGEYGIQHNPPQFQDSIQTCELTDNSNTLLDIGDSIVQSPIASILKTDTPHHTVPFSLI